MIPVIYLNYQLYTEGIETTAPYRRIIFAMYISGGIFTGLVLL